MPTRDLGEFTFEVQIGEEKMKLLNELCLFPMHTLHQKHTKKCDEITVLFSDPATIIWKDGKKYVSKAHNEKFDEEKGLLMCLAKSNGYTHRDIQRMIKGARKEGRKEVK